MRARRRGRLGVGGSRPDGRSRGRPRPRTEVTPQFVADVAAREAVTDHDLAAFVDVVQAEIGPPEGSWVHYGLTSSDVVDTALCSTLVSAADLLIAAASGLIRGAEGPRGRAHSTRRWRAARTACTPNRRPSGSSSPLVPAGRPRQEPAEESRRTASRSASSRGRRHLLEHRPARGGIRLQRARAEPVPATQVISRDRHAEYLCACASVGATSRRSRPRSVTWHVPSWRSRREIRRRAEGELVDAPQAQPGALREAGRALRGCSAVTSSPGWRMWLSGTSGTSRTALSNVSSFRTRRCSPTTCCDRATGLVEGLGR